MQNLVILKKRELDWKITIVIQTARPQTKTSAVILGIHESGNSDWEEKLIDGQDELLQPQLRYAGLPGLKYAPHSYLVSEIETN
jgi:hypothetical protein